MNEKNKKNKRMGNMPVSSYDRSENVVSMICSKNWPLYDPMLVNLSLNVMIYSFALSLILFSFFPPFAIATNEEIDFQIK